MPTNIQLESLNLFSSIKIITLLKTRLILLVLCTSLFACDNLPSTPPPKEESEKSVPSNIDISMQDPKSIPNSDVVLYKLITTQLPTNRFEKRIASQLPRYCWNLLFKNVKTNESHVLDSVQKMVIDSYYITTTKEGDTQLFYKIITDDFNQDGALSEEDPFCLFLSNQNGRNRKRLTPKGYHVLDWFYHQESNQVLVDVLNLEDATSHSLIINCLTQQIVSDQLKKVADKKVRNVFQQVWVNDK
ncbi:MAG: hypothetical protein AB8B61_01520 [Cyclobacteriaceae bacterium]